MTDATQPLRPYSGSMDPPSWASRPKPRATPNSPWLQRASLQTRDTKELPGEHLCQHRYHRRRGQRDDCPRHQYVHSMPLYRHGELDEAARVLDSAVREHDWSRAMAI